LVQSGENPFLADGPGDKRKGPVLGPERRVAYGEERRAAVRYGTCEREKMPLE
jgi:hypothetical protein